MTLKSYPLFLIFAAITACTPYSESFDCPPGRGVGCKSLNLINQMVEQGQLPLEEESENDFQDTPRHLPDKQTSFDKGLYEARSINHSRSLQPKEPLLSATHLKLWVGSYEEGPGIIHGPSMVYVVLNKPGQENGSAQSTTDKP